MDEQHERTGMMTAEAPNPAAEVLVAVSDAGTAASIAAVLRQDGLQVTLAARASEAVARLRARRFAVALVELAPDAGVDLGADPQELARLQACLHGAHLILLARYAALDSALGALRAGAYDYLMKPVDVDDLRATVHRALDHQQARYELQAREHDLEAARADALQADALRADARQEVEEATEELLLQVDELKQANEELQEAQEQHDRLVAMVAHEMRGPLNPIINYAQLAKRPGIEAETHDRYMDLIVEHAFRLNRMVDDLRTATRLSTDQFALDRHNCDLIAAVAEVVEHFVTSEQGRRFSLEAAAPALCGEVDRDRVIQAVRNLLDNAVKYSAKDGAIEVRVWSDEHLAYISVADYGAGLSEEEMARIFEAFVRGSRDQDEAGSGLGLYITRGIAQAHGGHLTVRNRIADQRAGGAIFTIDLPLCAPEPPA